MSTWVLVRGWTREARHWGDFPAQLQAAVPEARIVALDLPGNGVFRDRRSPLSIAAMVKHSRQALGTQSIEGPCYLLGLSLGAMVCIDWAARHPTEVAGCVLLSTSLRPFSAFHERLRPGTYATLSRLIFLPGEAQAREAAILGLTSAHVTPRAGLIAAWTRYGRERPVSRGNALRQLVAAARYRAPASPPPVPILVLAAQGDRLVDPSCSLNLARRWGAAIALHPTAGHDLALDDGAWVGAQVQQWLRRT